MTAGRTATARRPATAPRRSTAPPSWSRPSCTPTQPLTFADLQEASGLAKSTTSRMLAALERTGLVERDLSGSYVAGSLFWLYAARHDPWEELVRLARPAMERIGDRDPRDRAPLGDPRRAGRPGGAGRLPLPARHPRLDRDRGPGAHLGPRQGVLRLGRAAGPDGRPSSGSPSRPSPTPSSCAATASSTRKRGWAVTRDELEVGLTGVAVPVQGPRGDVVAALGISGPTPRLEDRLDEVGRHLSDRGGALSSLLRGHIPTPKEKEGVA